jgi:hypothetical protein
LLLACWGGTLRAQVINAALPAFELEKWIDVNKTDGPITIHRIRVSEDQAGIRSKSAEMALNRAYVQRIAVQIEYTNESSRRYKSHIAVNMADANGEAVDGFSDDEGLEPNKSRGLVTRSFPASKYGLQRVTRIDLEIKLTP